MGHNRFLNRALHGPTLSGKQALLLGVTVIAVPTLIRAAVGDAVSHAVFLTYVPSMIVAAMLLKPRDAAIVALICAVSADYFFMTPRFAFAATPDDFFSIGLLLLVSAMIIALMAAVRRFLSHCLAPDEHSTGVIFSERQGEAWAHWDSTRPSVKLGPHKKVAEMMEDYVAQVGLGERLAGRKREEGAEVLKFRQRRRKR